jgi:hypothetical protein
MGVMLTAEPKLKRYKKYGRSWLRPCKLGTLSWEASTPFDWSKKLQPELTHLQQRLKIMRPIQRWRDSVNINLWIFPRQQTKIYSYLKLYQYVNKHVSFACDYQGWEDCCETSPLQVPSPFVSICSVTPEPRGSGLAMEQREASMATSDGFPLLFPDKMAPAV